MIAIYQRGVYYTTIIGFKGKLFMFIIMVMRGFRIILTIVLTYKIQNRNGIIGFLVVKIMMQQYRKL